MPLSDAIRALSAFEPPAALPPCDLALLAEVLEANGLAPIASYHLETCALGAGVPAQFREKLLALYQGVVNDNVYRVMTLRGALKASPVPVVVLSGLAAVDWLYPHLAFRPLGDLRLAVRGEDGARFAEAAKGAGFRVEAVAGGGRGAAFGDDRVRFTIQEGLWQGAPPDAGSSTGPRRCPPSDRRSGAPPRRTCFSPRWPSRPSRGSTHRSSPSWTCGSCSGSTRRLIHGT